MKQVFDIALDNDLDLIIENGDFRIAESTIQHINLLLKTSPGDWKHAPTLGAALAAWLKEDNLLSSGLQNKVQSTLEADGLKVKKLSIEANQLAIEAHYNQ
jgi:hypothetical protein